MQEEIAFLKRRGELIDANDLEKDLDDIIMEESSRDDRGKSVSEETEH